MATIDVTDIHSITLTTSPEKNAFFLEICLKIRRIPEFKKDYSDPDSGMSVGVKHQDVCCEAKWRLESPEQLGQLLPLSWDLILRSHDEPDLDWEDLLGTDKERRHYVAAARLAELRRFEYDWKAFQRIIGTIAREHWPEEEWFDVTASFFDRYAPRPSLH